MNYYFTALLWKTYDNGSMTNLGLLKSDEDNLPLLFETQEKVKNYIENDLSYSDMEYTIIEIKSAQNQQKELKYKEPYDLADVLNVLSAAKCYLDYFDYIKIWGEQLGSHIWKQHGSDILTIWRSGLTLEQKEQFVHYIIKMDKEKGKNYYQK